jgi:flagellar motor protein MotB
VRKYQLPYLLPAFSILIFFISCVSQKKVTSAKNKLSVIDSQLLKYNKTLNELDSQRKNKKEQNEIDDTANFRIQEFIAKTTATIDKLNAGNSILIENTIVDRADWEKLVKSLSLSRKSSKQIGDKIVFLTDLVNRNLVIKIDQDIIFEPGQYIVTQAMVDVIGKFFEPPAKEIDLFIKKYPDFPLSLVITAKGYADGTSIAEGTPLYKNLTARLKLNTTAPDNKELNKELSRARAEEVITLFQKFAAGRSGNGSYLKNVLYLHEGKGEAPPDPKITDYKTDDPRRRVVLLYWSVFPE